MAECRVLTLSVAQHNSKSSMHTTASGSLLLRGFHWIPILVFRRTGCVSNTWSPVFDPVLRSGWMLCLSGGRCTQAIAEWPLPSPRRFMSRFGSVCQNGHAVRSQRRLVSGTGFNLSVRMDTHAFVKKGCIRVLVQFFDRWRWMCSDFDSISESSMYTFVVWFNSVRAVSRYGLGPCSVQSTPSPVPFDVRTLYCPTVGYR